MADEPTLDPKAFNNLTKSVDNFNDSIEDGLKGLTKLNRSLDNSADDADKSMNRVIKSIRKLTKAITPSIKEFDRFSDVAANAEKGVSLIAKSYANSFYVGNKQGMIAMSVIARNGLAMAKLGRQIQITNGDLTDASANYKNYVDKIAASRDEISRLTKEQAHWNDEIKKGGEAADIARTKLVETETAIKKHEESITADTAEMNNWLKKSFALTEAAKNQRNKLIDLNKTMLSSAEAERAANREARILSGGWTAVAASAEGIIDSKVFEYIKKAGTLGLVIGGLHMMSKAMSQVSDHALATSRIALSLGDTSQTGLGRMGQSAKDAQAEVSKLTSLSISLGYEGEELSNVMNRVRSSIRMDKEGRLSSEKIRNLTAEIATFARISNMDLGDATALMENRIKRYGMSADQAVASMKEMRSTILSMTAGNKGNTIAMNDMVNIIEEASAASQSYVVDTRIMTQALRGAVNQAENLGVAQKQAQDVAKAVGKVMSNSPDFIKIPAGFTLVDQLLGGDSDKLLNKLDKGTRQQVKDIQSSLRSGKLDYYVGAKALMDLIGQTDAGLDAQSKQLEATILQGPVAAELIAEQYHIENRATAVMVTKMMQDAMDMRQRIEAGGGKVSFSTAMVKDTALFNASIMAAKKNSKDLTDQRVRDELLLDMQKKGLSRTQAEDYLKDYQDAEKAVAADRVQLGKLKKDGELKNAQEISELEAKIFAATTDKQTQSLNKMLRPTEAILNDIEAAGIKLQEGDMGEVVLNADALKAAGIKNSDDLAKKMGTTYKDATGEQKDKLDNIIKLAAKGELVRDSIDDLRTDFSKENQKAMDAADNRTNGLLGPIKRLYAWAKGMAADMGALGPMLTGVLGLGGVIAGVWLLHRGQRANSLMVVNMMKQPIYNNVLKALKAADAGATPDSDFEGKGKKDKKKKSKVKTVAKKWGRGVKKRLNATSGGRWATKAAGSIGRRGGALLKRGGDVGKGLLKGGLKRAPLVGALLGGGLAAKDLYDTYKETGKVSGKDVAKTGGGVFGGLGGAAAGAAIGTLLLPGIGTAIGAALGGWAGEEVGQWGAGKAADIITAPKETPVDAETGASLAKSQDVTVGQLAEAGAGSVTGKPSLMPEPAPMPAGSTRRQMANIGTSGSSSSLESNLSPGSVTPDGALTLKVRGIYDIFSQYMKERLA